MSRTEQRTVEFGLGGVPLMTPLEALFSWIATALMSCAVVLGLVAIARESGGWGIGAFAMLLVSWMLLSVSRMFR